MKSTQLLGETCTNSDWDEFRGPFLETPDNFLGPKTISGAQHSPTAIQFLLIFKGKF